MRLPPRPFVCITGASSGIGESLARNYAKRKGKILLVARRLERLESLCAELNRSGCEATFLVADVSNHDFSDRLSQSLESFGRLDILVANAGYGVSGTFESLSEEDYVRQFETNVWGVMRTVKGALPLLKESHGQIAIVGSVNSYLSLPTAGAYCMSKFAIRAFSDALRPEVAVHGVGVTLLCPGFVTSEIRQIDNFGVYHGRAKDPVPSWIRMPADTAARKMIRAIDSRSPEAIITFHGKVGVWITRHFPWIIRWLLRYWSRRPFSNRAWNAGGNAGGTPGSGA